MKKTESITFRCNIEIKNKLDKIAIEEDRSVSYIINRILEQVLKEEQENG